MCRIPTLERDPQKGNRHRKRRCKGLAMVDVKSMVANIEGQSLQSLANRMSPELRRFLDAVWAQRNDPHLDMYKIYVGGRSHTMPEGDYDSRIEYPWPIEYNSDLVETFLTCVATTTPTPVRVQPWGALAEFGLGDDFAEMKEWCAEQAEFYPHLWKRVVLRDLGHSFFHFPTGRSAFRRVYMSVERPHRGEVLKFVVNRIRNGIAGVTNAKASGPLADGLDNVVIYCDSMEVMTKVLDEIARYQNKEAKAGWFKRETIQIARRITEHGGQPVRGVATAVEPGAHPDVLEKMELTRRPSFGDFWEMILEPLLDQARGPVGGVGKSGTQVQFYDLVLKRLKVLGIDPRRPDL